MKWKNQELNTQKKPKNGQNPYTALMRNIYFCLTFTRIAIEKYFIMIYNQPQFVILRSLFRAKQDHNRPPYRINVKSQMEIIT